MHINLIFINMRARRYESIQESTSHTHRLLPKNLFYYEMNIRKFPPLGSSYKFIHAFMIILLFLTEFMKIVAFFHEELKRRKKKISGSAIYIYKFVSAHLLLKTEKTK